MCSTPKGSGKTTRQVNRVDEDIDYDAYAQMLRRASASFEHCQEEKHSPSQPETDKEPG